MFVLDNYTIDTSNNHGYEILHQDSFLLGQNEYQEVLSLMEEARSLYRLDSNRKNDAYRYKLFLDGVKIYDEYGRAIEPYYQLIKTLEKDSIIKLDLACW